MKIIIVEGTDRTGKDTLINELKNMAYHTLIVHCGKPAGNTLYEQNMRQDILFNDYTINKKDKCLTCEHWKSNYDYIVNKHIEEAKKEPKYL